MRIVVCPVCGRKYRFDDSKMSKEEIKVKCRKCENIFVILKDMFSSAEREAPPSPPSMGELSSEPAEDARPMTFVIKKVPNETVRLRIAARLMPPTREKLSELNRRLSKTPVTLRCEMTPKEADNLLRAIESLGAEAEFYQTDGSRRSEIWGTEDVPKGRRKRWVAAAVLILLLVLVGGLSYHMYREVQRTHVLEQQGIDSVIPAGAVLYLRFKDIEKNWQKIQENAVRGGLGSLFENLKSMPQVQRLLFRKRDWESAMGLPFFHPNLMDLIGSDVRVAMYVGDPSGAPQFVLTLKANLKIKLMETIGRRWIAHWQDRSSLRQIDQGQGVYAFQPQGLTREIYFFSEGMVYVVSTSRELIRTSRSLSKGRLQANDSLRSVSLLAQKGEGEGINQIGLFYVGVRNLVGARFGKKQSDDSVHLFDSLEGYGDVLGTISYGRGLVVESVMTVHRESVDQPLRALLECPPAPNKTLAYVPSNTIVYASNP